MDDYTPYLAIGAGLFAVGAIGFLARRHMILMVLSTEMMLHGVALTLVTFSRIHGTNEGQAFTIFVLTVAACEAGLALSLFLALYQKSKSLDIDIWAELREPGISPRKAPPPEAGSSAEIEEEALPQLTPAGRQPMVQEDEYASASPR